MNRIHFVLSIFVFVFFCCAEPKTQTSKVEIDSVKTPKIEVKKQSKFPFTKSENGIDWRVLQDGLSVAYVASPEKSFVNNSMLTIIKIKPENFDIELYSATNQSNKESRTVKTWSEEKNLTFVVNAGMHDGESTQGFRHGLTNRSLLKTEHHTNNPNLTTNKKRERAVLALKRTSEDVPEAKIIDLDFENWSKWKTKYHSFSQGLRLIDIHQKNRWPKNNLKWSMVISAIDKDGNLLFIFTRSPYTMHNHINNLLKLPLNIYNAMYLEGGPEASFYLKTPDTVLYAVGSYETNFTEHDENEEFWHIANVIGVKNK